MTRKANRDDVFADLPLREHADRGNGNTHSIDLDLVERWLETEDLPPQVQLLKLEEFSAILREEAQDDVFGELEELIASLEMKIYMLRQGSGGAGKHRNEATGDVFAAAE